MGDIMDTALPVGTAVAEWDTTYSGRGSDSFQAEVMGLKGFHKLGLVEDLATGRVWRLEADEGTYLRGENKAPAPLMYWGAGIHADVLCRVWAIAADRGVQLSVVKATIRQGFAAKGSFARAEAVALVFGLSCAIELEGAASDDQLAALAAEAVSSSPAIAALTSSGHGLFALTTNGRPTEVDGIPQLSGSEAVDPMRRHAVMPAGTGEVLSVLPILDFQPGSPDRTLVLGDNSDRSVDFHVEATGELEPASGTVWTSVGFPEVTGDRWSLRSHPAGTSAPAPLAYFSIGTAFCYHTQLCRYIAVRHLPLDGARLSQLSDFSVDGAVASASPLATHVFLNGRCDENQTRSLMTVAANICYAHSALGADVELTTSVTTRSAAALPEGVAG